MAMIPESEAPRDSAGKTIVSGLLVLLGVAGLLMSLCGGLFTVMAFSSQGGADFMLAIALPCLAIGALIAWACFRAVGRRHRTGPYEDEGPPDRPDGVSSDPAKRTEE